MSGSNIVFVLTGSIACMKACDAISRLVQRGHCVRTVATPSALQFVGPATLEGLTGTPALSDLFQRGAAMEHINLSRWADAVVYCPVTAGTLNRLAAGLADDLPGALYLARDRRKPLLLFPAMNPAMWSHPATCRAVAQIAADGGEMQDVASGRVACGETGEGRLLEADEIVARIERSLAPKNAEPRLRVLVTSGGTTEPIDGVRVLTNTSSGATGAAIATYLARQGHDVVLLRAENSQRPQVGCREERFRSFADLEAALARILDHGRGGFDFVIHAAAVADFSVDHIQVDGRRVERNAKLGSDAAPVVVLKPNPKLIATMHVQAGRKAGIVAFKLTHGAPPETVNAAVQAVAAHEGVVLVVHNDLAAKTQADFPATLVDPRNPLRAQTVSRESLPAAIEHYLVGQRALDRA
jgi:phosphopantothenoylcysteine decarboxylase / phosphopantothenate---cysteine ligase